MSLKRFFFILTKNDIIGIKTNTGTFKINQKILKFFTKNNLTDFHFWSLQKLNLEKVVFKRKKSYFLSH